MPKRWKCRVHPALMGHCAGSRGNWSNGGLWMRLATLQGNEHSPTGTCSKPELLQNNILKQSMLWTDPKEFFIHEICRFCLANSFFRCHEIWMRQAFSPNCSIPTARLAYLCLGVVGHMLLVVYCCCRCALPCDMGAWMRRSWTQQTTGCFSNPLYSRDHSSPW